MPSEGWDVIYTDDNGIKYYIEMKNKHNTMNSSSAAKTYMRFQNHLLNAKDKDVSICALVEVIASKSQNIEWVIILEKQKKLPNKKLRRISIDKFYEIVTGDKNAFKDLCIQLPRTIEKLVKSQQDFKIERDTVIEDLKKLDPDILLALYKLTFKTDEGFFW